MDKIEDFGNSPYKTDSGLDHGSSSSFPSPLEYLLILVQSRKVLLSFALVGILVGLIVNLLMPVKYEARVSFISSVNSSESSFNNGSGLGQLAAILAKTEHSSSALYLFLFDSYLLQDKIILKQNLVKHYGLNKTSAARGVLRKATFVEPGESGEGYVVTVRDRDPKVAEAIAAQYVEELNQALSKIAITGAQRQTVFLKERLEHVLKELRAAEDEFSGFSKENALVMPEQQLGADLALKSEIDRLLFGEYLKYENLKRVERVGASPQLRELKAILKDLEGKRDELIYGHKKVEGVDAHDIKSTTSDKLKKPRNSSRISISETPELLVNYSRFKREVEIKSRVYEVLLQEYEISRASEAKERISVEIVDTSESYGPVRPRKFLNIMISLFLFLVLGVLFILTKYAVSIIKNDEKQAFIMEQLVSEAGNFKNEVSSLGKKVVRKRS